MFIFLLNTIIRRLDARPAHPPFRSSEPTTFTLQRFLIWHSVIGRAASWMFESRPLLASCSSWGLPQALVRQALASPPRLLSTHTLIRFLHCSPTAKSSALLLTRSECSSLGCLPNAARRKAAPCAVSSNYFLSGLPPSKTFCLLFSRTTLLSPCACLSQ